MNQLTYIVRGCRRTLITYTSGQVSNGWVSASDGMRMSRRRSFCPVCTVSSHGQASVPMRDRWGPTKFDRCPLPLVVLTDSLASRGHTGRFIPATATRTKVSVLQCSTRRRGTACRVTKMRVVAYTSKSFVGGTTFLGLLKCGKG